MRMSLTSEVGRPTLCERRGGVRTGSRRRRRGGERSERRERSTHVAPLLELDAVDALDADARVDTAADDGAIDVHAAADELDVLALDEAVLLGELETLDAAELADVLQDREGRSVKRCLR